MGARKIDNTRKIVELTEALDSLGFGPAIMFGDGLMFSVHRAATCNTCGAVVMLHATVKHHDWHENDL